jgi:protein TonB
MNFKLSPLLAAVLVTHIIFLFYPLKEVGHHNSSQASKRSHQQSLVWHSTDSHDENVKIKEKIQHSRPQPKPQKNNAQVSPLIPPQENTPASSNSLDRPQVNPAQLSSYKAELRALIERNKFYPSSSRRLGQTGTVVVAFTLLKDGHIIDVKVDTPSPFEKLNASAMDAVKKVVRFKPFPDEIEESKLDVKVSLKFLMI